ncbi:MAG: homoserine O-acetyltransferase/O-succinyltransferase family protein [Methylovirgula sp.]
MSFASFIPPSPKADVLEIALVNNMPDQALAATEAQFARLIRDQGVGLNIRWRNYVLPGLARSETARRYLARTHESLEALYSRGADAMIVTGSEPLAARLNDEPYWPALTQLLEWARSHTVSTIWSCLAAHAGVLYLDGIERRRAVQKISGLYSFETTSSDWMDRPRKSRILTPHSRYNGLGREDLERCGYSISSYSGDVGVNVFWRREPSLFIFLQGHPEYDADTLLKEYRRDVIRFIEGARADYPAVPANYFREATSEALQALRLRAVKNPNVGCVDALTALLSRERCARRWADDTAHFFGKWLKIVMRDRTSLQTA